MKLVPVRITKSDGTKRMIGWIVGEAFVTMRNEREHMYRGGTNTLKQARKDGTSAWGLDAIACDGMLERGVKTIRIVTPWYIYETELINFKEHEDSFVLHHKPHRAQYFLNERVFMKRKRTEEDTQWLIDNIPIR